MTACRQRRIDRMAQNSILQCQNIEARNREGAPLRGIAGASSSAWREDPQGSHLNSDCNRSYSSDGALNVMTVVLLAEVNQVAVGARAGWLVCATPSPKPSF